MIPKRHPYLMIYSFIIGSVIVIMGSTCSTNAQKCPQHSDQNIEYVCIHDRCIEPLCQKCLPAHYQSHKEVGVSPHIEKLQEIKGKLLGSMKKQASVYAQTEDMNSAVKQIYPAEYIKEITREYFLRKRTANKSDISLNHLITTIEQSYSLANNPSIRQLHWTFLKQNTTANQGVLSHEYSHLY